MGTFCSHCPEFNTTSIEDILNAGSRLLSNKLTKAGPSFHFFWHNNQPETNRRNSIENIMSYTFPALYAFLEQ